MILSDSIIEKTLDVALSTGADFADIFVEETYSSQLSLLNRKADQAIVGTLYGAGIRLFFGHEVIYVTTNDLTESGMIAAAKKAAASRSAGSRIVTASQLNPYKFDSIHTFGQMPWETGRDHKFKWLNSVDQASRAHSSLVTQVSVNLSEKIQKVQIANSQGLHTFDQRAYARLTSEANVESEGKKESSYENVGHMGTNELFDRVDLKEFSKDNVDRALLLLKADYAPAGEMPVIMENAFGGVIFHEACGHGLETTSVEKNSSVFCGKLGEKIAHECVTAVDDGTIKNEWGSLNVDDEGRPTQRTVLIEKGVLKSYLVDEMGGRKTGYTPTGSGRKQSYKFAPASRMRNTFIERGTDKFEDMIKDIDYGLYAKKMGGGSVSPGTGDFNFSVQEAYIIKNGQIMQPVKGATLIGRGIEALGKITKVSDDLKLACGMCGSVSGTIPAAVGQPQILVSKMLVGGRANG